MFTDLAYEFICQGRNYQTWCMMNVKTRIVYDSLEVLREIPYFQPWKEQLFNRDEFTISSTHEITILKSPIRDPKNRIAGVLVLENQNYGQSKKGKPLLKCIPNDKNLPLFLIPYERSSGLFKLHYNKLIAMEFDHWDNKFPVGKLAEVFGNCNDKNAQCAYEWLCINLHRPKYIHTKSLPAIPMPEMYKELEVCRETNVIAIDKAGTLAHDDGFSTYIDEKSENHIVIHVTCVSIYIEHNRDKLWPLISPEGPSQILSNVYTRHGNRMAMLPSWFEKMCELGDSGKSTVVLCLDWNTTSDKYDWRLCRIQKITQYDYDDINLTENPVYQQIFKTIDLLRKSSGSQVENKLTSRNIVKFLMELYNRKAGELLKEQNKTCYFSEMPNPNYRGDIENVIVNWGREKVGKYSHEPIVGPYATCTSPLRRYVDIYNQSLLVSMLIHRDLNIGMKPIEECNEICRNIRKYETKCRLIDICEESCKMTEWLGIMLEKVGNTNAMYLPKLKTILHVKTSLEVELEIYKEYKLKLFYFEREADLYRRIKIEIQHAQIP